MKASFAPSVNIIRDSERSLEYISTPNAQRVAKHIIEDFNQGFHAFTLIGSYGTGKSSFLWALEQSLTAEGGYFEIDIPGNVEFFKFVGEASSIISAFAEKLEVQNSLKGNQEIFDALYQRYRKLGKDGTLFIVIDEFGKFLEQAAKSDPEREVYFIQQLAEFVNDEQRRIVLITTLHQNFEAYSLQLSKGQRSEWAKVKGRFRELLFNEPVEQLIFLATQVGQSVDNGAYLPMPDLRISELNEQAGVFQVNTTSELESDLDEKIYPLDFFSIQVLVRSLQVYGQNERSLFTFFATADPLGVQSWNPDESPFYNLANVYDYLWFNHKGLLSSKFNPHYSQWAAIKNSIERVESTFSEGIEDGVRVVKAIGLLGIFASKGASIDQGFIKAYGKSCLGIHAIDKSINRLEKRKIIRYRDFAKAYVLFEGTDVDIDAELHRVENKLDSKIDITHGLKAYFDFDTPVVAKSITYKKGTPRNFKYRISETPITDVPKDEVDGFINLIFNSKTTARMLSQVSKKNPEAVVYALFRDTDQIRKLLLEIIKTQKVLQDNSDDVVATKELRSILDHQVRLLNHFVMGRLFSDSVDWISRGKIENVRTKKELNGLLSKLCDEVYGSTPVFRNELVNKHKIASNIHNSRKRFLKALVNHWADEDLGFDSSKYPAEKTIYLTLLQKTGIHTPTANGFELKEPTSDFNEAWEACNAFLESAQDERLPLTNLYDVLKSRPYKLKQGLMDFLVPLYLFMRRGDYALYHDGRFVPLVNDSILYLVTRNPNDFALKAFQFSGTRLALFNRYREYLGLPPQSTLTNTAFVESVRPFMVLYKTLPEYCRNTRRLSLEAIHFREAIENAQDPEKVFFEDFPRALGMQLQDIVDSDEMLIRYADKLDESVQEIRQAYTELLNRVEQFIQREVVGEKLDFEGYKNSLQKRYAGLKEHRLAQHLRPFLMRIQSSLDERDSWISSMCHVLLRKPLEQISDQDETILYEKLIRATKELDNQRDMEAESEGSSQIAKIEVMKLGEGMYTEMIDIPPSLDSRVSELIDKIESYLDEKNTYTSTTKRQLILSAMIKLMKESKQ